MAIQVRVGRFLLLSDVARLIGCSGRRNGLGVGGERSGDGIGRGGQRGAAGGGRRAEPGGERRVGQHGADGGGKRLPDLAGRTSTAASSPTRSGMPPTRVATMATPARSASCRISGWPSHWLGSTNTVAPASRFGTSSRCPRNAASTPSEAARARSSPASGPSPAIASSGGGSRSRQVAAAASSVPKSFCGARRPTARTSGSGAERPPMGLAWLLRVVWFRAGGRWRGRLGGRRLPASAPRGRVRRTAPGRAPRATTRSSRR